MRLFKAAAIFSGPISQPIVLGAGRFTPIHVAGSGKYSSDGRHLFRLEASALDPEERETIARLGAASLANSTKSNYATTNRLFAMFCKQKKRKYEFPLGQDACLAFLSWLVNERNAKAGTLASHMAGLRHLHLVRGMPEPNLRMGLVGMAIKGRSRLDNDAGKPTRLPMTPELMKFLKAKIRDSSLAIPDKLLIWAVSTLAFHGCFRIHELLARTESIFDKKHNLLTEDVVRSTEADGRGCIQIRLKNPKERRDGSGTTVDVFETGEFDCPVAAFDKWMRAGLAQPGTVIFRWADGTPFTGRKMNLLLDEFINDAKELNLNGRVSSHSFRAGIPTLMARLGLSIKEIQAYGRWSSRACLLYMKGERTHRAEVAANMSSFHPKGSTPKAAGRRKSTLA